MKYDTISKEKGLLNNSSIRNNKGFTLVELIIVLTIISIVSLIAVPNLIKYVRSSQLIQYDDYAKTIYLSAQTFLTEARTNGTLDEFCSSLPKDQVISKSDITDTQIGEQKMNYLRLSKSEGLPDDSQLIDILEDYTYDKNVLDQSVCVEFDSSTGVVYSVSYSETADGFFYGSNLRQNGAVSIRDRSQETKDALRFGFYRGTQINAPLPKFELTDCDVLLKNEDRLHLEWTESESSNSDSVIGIDYVVEISDADSKEPIMRITVDGSDIMRELNGGGQRLERFLVKCPTEYYVDEEGQWLTTPEKRIEEHWLSKSGDFFDLVLDCVDTSVSPEYSLMQRYPQIGARDICGSVTAEADRHLSSQKMTSNTENSLFATEKSGRNFVFFETADSYSLSYPRHLYNMRFGEPSGTYKVGRNLSWKTAIQAGGMVNDNVISGVGSSAAAYPFSTTTFHYVDGVCSKDELPFTGKLSGNGYKISELYVTGKYGYDYQKTPVVYQGNNVGLLFENQGSIEKLTLDNIQVIAENLDSVGAFAGQNYGDIRECVITGTLHGGSKVGGIAGENVNNGCISDSKVTSPNISGSGNYVGTIVGSNGGSGKIVSCTAKSDITQGIEQVGGIAGLNEGIISMSSVTGRVKGGNNVGGAVGNNHGQVLSFTGTNLFLEGNDQLGGVAGENSGQVYGCNVTGGTGAKGLRGANNVGGIIGLNQEGGTVEKSNTGGGNIDGTGSHIGGIIGRNQSATLQILGPYTNKANVTGNSYVGGIVGTNSSTRGQITGCTNNGVIAARSEYAGGITGYNLGIIRDCVSNVISNLSESQLIAGSGGDYIGGIAGYNNGRIEGTSSGQMVQVKGIVAGNNFVGGIVGHNDTKGVIRSYEVIGGKVLAKGNFAGGYMGLNTARDISSDSGSVSDKGMELVANPAVVKGKLYVGGAIGANLVSVDTSGSKDVTLTFICDNVRGGSGGTTTFGAVEATAFAGGIIGYSGIVPEGTTEEDADQNLRNELARLAAIDPRTYEPAYAELSSHITTVIKNSNNRLGVKADLYAGGMVGMNSSESKLTIQQCVNYGTISSDTSNNKANPKADGFYFVGGITGRNSSSGIITGCENSGTVESLSKYIGGIVEVNEGLISSCKNSGNVKAQSSSTVYDLYGAGGIVGLNGRVSGVFDENALMKDCLSTQTSKVTGLSNVGALAGENNGKMENCTADGQVEATGNCAGGVVGANTAQGILNDITTIGGKVKAINYAGGIIGNNMSTGALTDLVNEAAVTGVNYVGGIAGSHKGTEISDCVNKGAVEATGTGVVEVGGIIGANPQGGIIRHCFNYGNVTGGGEYTGGITSYNSGQLIDCLARKSSEGAIATITGSFSAGGLVGLNQATGEILYTNSSENFREDGFVVLASNVKSKARTPGSPVNLGGLMAKNDSNIMKNIKNYVFTGTIQYVSPDNFDISTQNQFAGGIVGTNRNGDTIEQCSFEGKITGGNAGTGGITGSNFGTVKDITIGKEGASKGAYVVASSGISGGIIGVCQPGSEEINVVNGTDKSIDVLKVTGYQDVGGYFGLFQRETEKFVPYTNYAWVDGGAATGGVVGEVSIAKIKKFQISDCLNLGTVESTKDSNSSSATSGGVGGIVGKIESKYPVTIKNCENQALITSNSCYTGGIAGILMTTSSTENSVIINCSNENKILSKGIGFVGGIAGRIQGAVSVENSENNGNIQSDGANAGYIAGIVGVETSVNATERRIVNCVNNNEVRRNNSNSSGGFTAGILGGSGNSTNNNSKIYILGCENKGDIRNNGGKTGGIFGVINGIGEISNCTNNNAVYGAMPLTGGIGGQTWGQVTVNNCDNLGTISSGGSFIGGVMGELRDNGILQECQNTGSVSGTEMVGGIVGQLGNNARNSGVKAKAVKCINGDPDQPDKVTLKKFSSYGGGIAGRLAASEGGLEECINYGNISTVNGASLGSNAGGICGHLMAGNISGCENNGELFSNSDRHGGIVGQVDGNSTINNSINNAKISNGQSGGGIAGSVTGYMCTVQGSTNNGDITSNNWPAGIVGEAMKAPNPLIITACVNKGDISIKDTTSDAMSKGGGIIGELFIYGGSNASQITDCVNYGDLKRITYGGGGICGYVNRTNPTEANTLQIVRCVNYGSLEVDSGKRDTLFYQGGILGVSTQGTLIQECFNFGQIDVKNSKKVDSVGGILGSAADATTTVRRCINSAQILGGTQAVAVGGIVGRNSGFVESCQNTKIDPVNIDTEYTDAMKQMFRPGGTCPAPDGYQPLNVQAGVGQITGKDSVGGLVGSNASAEVRKIAIIYGVSTTVYDPYAFSKNTLNVQLLASGGNSGGIAGEVQGGSIIASYNTGEIIAELPGTERSVGGIAGHLGSNTYSDVTLAGVFDLGKLPGAGTTHTGHYYGGVAGVRAPETAASVSIKDSFYLADYVPGTTVQNIQGNWWVGNEPSFIGQSSDGVKDADGNVACQLGSPAVEQAYAAIAGINWSDPLTAEAALQNYLQSYEYELTKPEIISVDINPLSGNGYTVTWSGGQGILDGYRVLAKVTKPDGSVVRTFKSGMILPDQQRQLTIGFNDQEVGCYVEFGVEAVGQKPVTSDSPENWRTEKYLILPPQWTPQIEAKVVGTEPGKTIYHFTLTNWNDYLEENKPKKRYPILNEWMTDNAYDKYENGLGGFRMIINNENDKAVYFTKQADGTYAFDMGFDIPTGVASKTYTLSVVAMPTLTSSNAAATPYRYYVSNPWKGSLVVKQMLKLTPPDVGISYTGTLDTPAYDVKLTAVNNAAGFVYRIVETGSDNVLAQGTTAGGGAAVINIKDIPPELYGKNFTVYVKSLGDGETYLDSDEKIGATFRIPAPLPEPALEFKHLAPAADTFYSKTEGKDRYQISWTSTDGGILFAGQVRQTTGGKEKILLDGSTQTKNLLLDYSEDSDNDDYEIADNINIGVTLQRQGILGESLNSPAVTTGYIVPKRLPQVSKPNASRVDTTSLNHMVSWTGIDPSELTDCEGYQVFRVDYVASKPVYQLLASVDKNTTSALCTFDSEKDKGKLVEIFVIAKGKTISDSTGGQMPVRSDSLRGGRLTINMPGGLNPPQTVVATTPTTAALSVTAFEQALYEVSWKQSITGEEAQYHVRVIDENGELVSSPGEIGNPLSATMGDSVKNWSFNVSAAYAGQKLTVQVRASSQLQLSSDWVGTEITMPPVILDPPGHFAFAPDTSGSAITAGALTWDAVKYADYYELQFTTVTKSAIEGQPDEKATILITTSGISVEIPINTSEIQIKAVSDKEAYQDSQTAVLTPALGDGTFPFDVHMLPEAVAVDVRRQYFYGGIDGRTWEVVYKPELMT